MTLFYAKVDRITLNINNIKESTTPLKTALITAGMRQRQLADALQVHESLISDLCRGRRNPDKNLADRISRILGRQPGDIFPRGII
jgi:plasmid maintenance system antidote protein VapI